MATSPIQYPLGIPTVSGNTVTVDMMLDQPTRVTRALNDITLQNFWASRVFAFPGGVTGGAVLYDQLTANDLYTTRDVQNVEPGAEFPLVTVDRPVPLVAQVEKYGGKFFVTDEARDRNNPQQLTQGIVKLANTINRKTHTKLIAVLDASVTAVGAAVTMTGNNWSTYQPGGTSPTAPAGSPAADFAKAQLKADTTELGVTYDLWILNPADATNLRIGYGANLQGVLADNGVQIITSNRVAAGTAYAIAEGQVGELRVEKPLGTETWREYSTQRTWVQSDVRPVMYVTNPYAVIRVTGLAG